MCKWPQLDSNEVFSNGCESLSKLLDQYNLEEDHVKMKSDKDTCDFISFSHFLPNQLLLPERKFLYQSFLVIKFKLKYLNLKNSQKW